VNKLAGNNFSRRGQPALEASKEEFRKHLVLIDSDLNGHWYGMQRCLEQEIVRQTNAEVYEITPRRELRRLERRFGHGTRYAPLRRLLPKMQLRPPQVDVVWLVLMAPENYRLDLFRGWEDCAPYKVVYIFDTLPHQYRHVSRLFSDLTWNICITSFDDAVCDLEKATGRHWEQVDQAISRELFEPAPFEERPIHFSAYGRRHPKVHAATIAFCEQHKLYYDISTHSPGMPTTEPVQLLRHYSWHMCHSLFTFSWPVEATNSARAGHLSPITCRWFEAAAAGAVVIGQPPKNPHFCELFGEDFVVPIDPIGNISAIVDQLDLIWKRRRELHARAAALRAQLGSSLDWSDRVRQMLGFIQKQSRV